MIGTLGTPEMIFIFLLALVLFGPKELPELGRKVGRALTEFRRASNELKSTFDRELKTLEAEDRDATVRQLGHNVEAFGFDPVRSGHLKGLYVISLHDQIRQRHGAEIHTRAVHFLADVELAGHGLLLQ